MSSAICDTKPQMGYRLSEPIKNISADANIAFQYIAKTNFSQPKRSGFCSMSVFITIAIAYSKIYFP